MSRNGPAGSYFQQASTMAATAGPSRGSAGGPNGASPFYPSTALPTSRRERDAAPSLPQPGSNPRSQQHINSPEQVFPGGNAHLMAGQTHSLHGNNGNTPSPLLQHPASQGSLNHDMASHSSQQQQQQHTTQVYHGDFSHDFAGPHGTPSYHARELGESPNQPDLSMRHGNVQNQPPPHPPRAYSQPEYGEGLAGPSTPKHGALQTPSNAELARAIDSLGISLGGQITSLGAQLASLMTLTTRLVQLQQDPNNPSANSRASVPAVEDNVDRRRSGLASSMDASWTPVWTSEASSGMASTLPSTTRSSSSSALVYTEAAAPAQPPQLGSPYAPTATSTASAALQGRPVSRGFLQAFGATRLPAAHKEPTTQDGARGSLPLPRSYFNDALRFEGRPELSPSEADPPRAPAGRSAPVAPVLALFDKRTAAPGTVVPRMARLNELPPPPPPFRRGSEPQASTDAELSPLNVRGAVAPATSPRTAVANGAQTHPLLLQLMHDTELGELTSFEATAMDISGSLDGAGIVPARPGSSAKRQEPERAHSNPTLPVRAEQNAVAGPSKTRKSASKAAEGTDELNASPQPVRKENDWKFWAADSLQPPRGKGVPTTFKPKYASMADVRQERKSLTKRSMATLGRIPLKEYLEVGADYLAVRRTGRKCVADWLQPFTRMAKQDPLKVTACIHKLEHDHPVLAVCEDHWKARAILSQTVDNSLDELALKRRKADKLAGRASGTADPEAFATDNGADSRTATTSQANGTRRSAEDAELDDAGPPNRRLRLSEVNSLNDAMTGSSSTSGPSRIAIVDGGTGNVNAHGRRT